MNGGLYPIYFEEKKQNLALNLKYGQRQHLKEGNWEKYPFTLLAQRNANMPFNSITDQGCVFRKNRE